MTQTTCSHYGMCSLMMTRCLFHCLSSRVSSQMPRPRLFHTSFSLALARCHGNSESRLLYFNPTQTLLNNKEIQTNQKFLFFLRADLSLNTLQLSISRPVFRCHTIFMNYLQSLQMSALQFLINYTDNCLKIYYWKSFGEVYK